MVDAGTDMGLEWNILPHVTHILQTHHFESVPSFVSIVLLVRRSNKSYMQQKAPKEFLKLEAESFLF